jgi:hypothetical protein
MHALLLTLALALLPQEKKEERPLPTPEEVKATIAALDKAWQEGTKEDRVAAVKRASEVVHADVIARVAKALRDKEVDVQGAAIEALRFMEHPNALDALHEAYRRETKLRDNEERGATLLKAIAQHGQERSIALLAESPFETPSYTMTRARILGLGHVRSVKSVEALMAMMQLTGRGKADAFMEDFRLALVLLTGADQGTSRELWQRWWNDNKKTFTVAPAEPELPAVLAMKWRNYWGGAQEEGRRKRREDRGDDRPSQARNAWSA